MGNRAIITMEDHHGHCHPVALYVHWHGGLESVLAFMQFTWDAFDCGRDDLFTFHARLCQVIGNFFGDGLSLYGDRLSQADSWASGCNHGRFHFRVGPQGVTLPGREDAVEEAKRHRYWVGEHTIQDIIREAMPTRAERFQMVGGRFTAVKEMQP